MRICVWRQVFPLSDYGNSIVVHLSHGICSDARFFQRSVNSLGFPSMLLQWFLEQKFTVWIFTCRTVHPNRRYMLALSSVQYLPPQLLRMALSLLSSTDSPPIHSVIEYILQLLPPNCNLSSVVSVRCTSVVNLLAHRWNFRHKKVSNEDSDTQREN